MPSRPEWIFADSMPLFEKINSNKLIDIPTSIAHILECNLTFTNNPKEANCVSHGGNFHADDVFCNIFFGKFLPQAIIYRCGQEIPKEVNRNCTYIYDIGYGELDHHQKNKNGYHFNQNSLCKPIPYAAFGLVWSKFGKEFCDRIANAYGNSSLSQYLWDWIENNLVLNIDAADNGIYPYSPSNYDGFRTLTISNIVPLFTPAPSENQDYSLSLKYVTEMASLVFDRMILRGIWNFEHPEKVNQLSFYHSNFQAHRIFSKVILMRVFPNISEEELNRTLSKMSRYRSYHIPKYSSSREKEHIPTSLLGNIWDRYGKDYCSSICHDTDSIDYVWGSVRNELVHGIDAFVNGIKAVNDWDYMPYSIYTITDFFSLLSPMDCSVSTYSPAYETALLWANFILDRILKKAVDRISDRSYIEEKIETSTYHTLLLDRFAHWQEWVNTSSNPKAKDLWFVVFPSNKGIYNIQPIPFKYGPNGYRKGFPEIWYGCNSDELREVSGIPTAVFVHDEGFIGGAEDLIGAILMVMKSSECE